MMVLLVEHYDFVIGGDPDRDTIDLAVLDTATARLHAHVEEAADGPGYARMLAWARQNAPGRRVWALEGTGSFAAGLVTVLGEAGEDVIEITGQRRARGPKSDRIDAVAAARVALASDHHAAPRSRGLREALRQVIAARQGVLVSRTKAINELKSLIVLAPDDIRTQLRSHALKQQLHLIEAMEQYADHDIEHRITVVTLKSIAARIRFLQEQATALDPVILELVSDHPAGPALLEEPGVGPIVAAQILLSWSHRGRVRSEAAFAALAGVAPLEASSGQHVRHRLNRGGDRALNRALHTVAITRLRCHPETRAYAEQRAAQGKTHREIRRSLKRVLARRLYRCIQAATAPAAPAAAALTAA